MSNSFVIRNTEFKIDSCGLITVSAGIIHKTGKAITVSEPGYYQDCAIHLDGQLVGVMLEHEAKLLKAYVRQQQLINREKAGLAA